MAAYRRQYVDPDLFTPLAEESGLIFPITDQVIKVVIQDMQKTLISDRILHIAINLSAQNIKTGRILTVLENALRQKGHTGPTNFVGGN